MLRLCACACAVFAWCVEAPQQPLVRVVSYAVLSSHVQGCTVVFTADFTLYKSSLQRLCGAALQWDVVQMTVVLVNMLAKSAPYWRLLPPLWYLSVGTKAAAFVCMLMYPRRCSLLSLACPLAESQRRKCWVSVSLQGVLVQVHRVDLPWLCLTMYRLQLCTSAFGSATGFVQPTAGEQQPAT